MEIDHRIIVAIHVPVSGLSVIRQRDTLADVQNKYCNMFPKDYIVLIFPHFLEEMKCIIEILNTENIQTDLKDLEEIISSFEEMKNFSISNKTISKYNL